MTQPRTEATRTKVGLTALAIALVALVALTFLPTPYVIQKPGPVYNTLGTALDADGEEIPLIQIDDAETFPTDGALDLTTVQVVGSRERPVSWFELALAWVDSSKAVVPIESVFPEGVTREQREQRNSMLMVDSQHEATAAALRQLGEEVPATISVVEVLDDGASAGLLEADDQITEIDGVAVSDMDALRAKIQEAEGKAVELTVVRDDEEQTVTVTPQKREANGTTTWLIGVTLILEYEFPIDVTLQLNNVGGPSAGLMFALGIIDVLTPGELNGGETVAGTGTINGLGDVGPIGGIRQKLYGARDAGATYFFAPESNCAEVVGRVPDGLQVVKTATLDDALDALEVIAEGGDVADLPTCEAAAK